MGASRHCFAMSQERRIVLLPQGLNQARSGYLHYVPLWQSIVHDLPQETVKVLVCEYARAARYSEVPEVETCLHLLLSSIDRRADIKMVDLSETNIFDFIKHADVVYFVEELHNVFCGASLRRRKS